jgi:sugar/nucleoside kinase (ribokinase family)
MDMRKFDVVIAGYICVDLIPEFHKDKSHVSLSEFFKPGKLIEIKGLSAVLGGAVANTGMVMKKFSKNVLLNGSIGDDFIGKIARESLDKCGLSEGIRTVKDYRTAFGLVIAPPQIDRIFLESLGCSKLFDISHINFDAIAQSRLFHFGYPPLLRQFYQKEGSQLLDMFSKVKSLDVVTSLDFSLPDAGGESGSINWPEILQRILPFTDIFVPSLEEALQIMMPDEYAQIEASFDKIDFIDRIPVSTIRQLGKRIIDCGAKIVLLKAGHSGAYLWTGDISSLNEKSGFTLSAEKWNYCELWCPAYPVDNDKFINASGAGDTSAAAFLSAILNGEGPETSLRYAAIAGRNSLYCYDIYNEISTWDEIAMEMKSESNEIINLRLSKQAHLSNT